MDNINPEEGIVFLGYHKNPEIIEKMLANQLGNVEGRFTDEILKTFTNTNGNILYVPNLLELTGKILTTNNN